MIIRNGMIHDAIHPTAYQADVLIENGKIKKIAANIQSDGSEECDVLGYDVWPGFIDAHSHLGLFGFSGSASKDIDELTKSIMPQNRAIDGVNPMEDGFRSARFSGITTICVGPGSNGAIGGTHVVIKTAGRRIDDMVVKNPCAMKIAFGENPKVSSSDKKASRMTIASQIRDTLYKALDYLRRKEAANGDILKTPVWNSEYEALIPVLKKEIPLKAHVHRADDMFTAIRIAKEFDLRLTLEHVSDGGFFCDVLAKEGYPICAGPFFNQSHKEENRNRSIARAAKMVQSGCHVCLMSDSPVDAEWCLPICAGLLVREGLDAFTALKTITINAAEHLGVDDRIGSLEEGKDADLVITKGNALELSGKVEMVFINGKKITE